MLTVCGPVGPSLAYLTVFGSLVFPETTRGPILPAGPHPVLTSFRVTLNPA